MHLEQEKQKAELIRLRIGILDFFSDVQFYIPYSEVRVNGTFEPVLGFDTSYYKRVGCG